LIFDITWKIEEVIGIRQYQIDFVSQIHNSILVWDVSDHDSGAWVSGDLFLTYLEATLALARSAAIQITLDVGIANVIIVGVHVDCACITLFKRIVD